MDSSRHGLSPGAQALGTTLFKDQGKAAPIDYSRYVKRFSSSTECGSNSCKDLNYREHFHCLDCNSRVFVKKEEMIRHFKWHKKRDESLQHGFLRYSPMDDCSEKFPGCSHNRKQTHYHCLKEGCDKVYISTSDVQMHANYHRKDSAIIQEGFQRFRATEDCNTSSCAFSGQRTTHFHCRRQGCNFTFKNKADMEKHKSYHIKDEQLNKDGFKKFMKHEHCTFENCRFSRVCNHIHCIRPGCIYVLHSSGQLYSHKRKHERRENEMAYRKFKLAQSMMRSLGENQVFALQNFGNELKASEAALSGQMAGAVPGIHPSPSSGLPVSLSTSSTSGLTSDSSAVSYTDALQHSLSKYTALLAAGGAQHLDSSALAAVHGIPGIDSLSMMDLSTDFLKARSDDAWKKYLSRYTANDPCKPNCDFLYKDHYHCNAENCSMVFRSKDGVREHSRNHEQQDQVTEAFYTTVEAGQGSCCPSDCPYQSKERHYHCGWQSCREIILPSDKPFRRLDHYKMHEYSHKLNLAKDPLTFTMASSIDGIFKRKRGRPPKNRIMEFPVPSGASELSSAIYTSFKLPKPNNQPTTTAFEKAATSFVLSGSMGSLSPTRSKPHLSLNPTGSSSDSMMQSITHQKVEMEDGFYVFPENTACPTQVCPLYGKHHYHCAQPRCYYITERSDILVLHSKDFHENIDIMEGFVFFDRSVDCLLPGCQSNKVNRHFHCTRPNCNYTFVRYSTMLQHNEKHKEAENGVTTSSKLRGSPPATSLPSPSRPAATSPLNVSIAAHGTAGIQSPVSVKTECPSPPPNAATSSATVSEPRTPSPTSAGSPSAKPTVVKASGTFYPLSAFPHAYSSKQQQQSFLRAMSHGVNDAASPAAGESLMMTAEETGSSGGNCTRLSAEWQALLESHVAYSEERSCGRSTCKLRHKDHVHCTYCNQAFSKLSQLQPHIRKHMGSASPTGGGGGTSSRLTMSEDDSSDRQDDDDDETGLDLMGGGHQEEDDEEEDDDAESSEQSNASSSNPFAMLPRSSPSTDSTPSSHHLSYSAAFLATSAAGGASHSMNAAAGEQLFNTFPSAGAPGGVVHPGTSSTTINFLASSGASPLHHNGSSAADFEGEHGGSSHDSMPGSGIPSPCGSLDSDPSSPLHAKRKRSGLAMSAAMMRHGGGAADVEACTPETKKAKTACLRILKDEPIPEGYTRYRFNEDCRYTHCGYREHQTHFHCMRKDCGYSFCDKTRFVQHTARHERLDTLMGGDFHQFRATVPCGRLDCIYTTSPCSMANKASHFHCLKCDFVCTDTNKVVAHRRQHQKLDSIMAAGFEKFTTLQPCRIEGCTHNQRQTHYHCVKCQYAVLGLSQMSAHKYRHLE